MDRGSEQDATSGTQSRIACRQTAREGGAGSGSLRRLTGDGQNASESDATEEWFHRAVIYQVDSSLFYDANGDGFGDLAGIRQSYTTIRSLGATVLWLTAPISLLSAG